VKVAFNIDYVHPRNTGIGRYGVELMKACIGIDVPCQVWMTRYMRDFPPISSGVTERTVYYPWPRRITDYLWPSIQAFRQGIDWVHSANCDLLPRSPAYRQVCMIHDLGPFMYGHMKTAKDTGTWQRRIRQVAANADCIVVNSLATREDLLSIFPSAAEKVFATPLGIDHFPETGRNSKRGRHILNVGTVEPRKNVDGLLRAYAGLSSRMDIPPLVIAGKDGFRAEEYRRLTTELGIEDNVVFTGYISDETLVKLYSEALCLVHPAHHEGFGFTVPEAFTWGLPVAASCTGGLGEFFSECVWPVEPSSVESIAFGLLQALEKGVTPRQERARMVARRNLTWKNCALKTLEAMKKA
jgi:glycosyltransferase involved in cell wall biosynthesis